MSAQTRRSLSSKGLLAVTAVCLATMMLAVATPAQTADRILIRGVIGDSSTPPPEFTTWRAICYYDLPYPSAGNFIRVHTFTTNPIREIDIWGRPCGDAMPLNTWLEVQFFNDGVPSSYNNLTPRSIDGFDFLSQSPYFNGSAAPNPTCPQTGDCRLDVSFFAKFGNVHGQVRMPNGTPWPGVRLHAWVRQNFFAIDESQPGQGPEDRVYLGYADTDGDGYYNFMPSGAPALYRQNNWAQSRARFQYQLSNVPNQFDVMISPGTEPPVFDRNNLDAGGLIFPSGLTQMDIVAINVDGRESDEPRPGSGGEDTPVRNWGGAGADEHCDEDPGSYCSVPNPINIVTGNVYLDQTDAVLVGARRTVALARGYNSRRARAGLGGIFGRGWEHSFEKSITPLSSALVRLEQGSGLTAYFEDNDHDLTFRASTPPTETSWIVKGASGWTRYFVQGGRETYDAAGRLTSQVDMAEKATTFGRDGAGRLLSITVPGGRALTLGYTGEQVTSLSGPAGTIATYSYTPEGLLTQVRYPNGNGTEGYDFTYDAEGQLLTLKDMTGRTLERHEYVDGKGTVTELAGGRERFALTYNAGLTTVTDGLGNLTSYEHTEARGFPRLLTRLSGPCESCPDGTQSLSWAYEPAGRWTQQVTATGQVTERNLTPEGFVESLTRRDASGDNSRTISYVRDGFGRVTTRTAPEGTTRYTYVDAGVQSVTDALNRTTTMAYDSATQLPSSVTDARNKVWPVSYTPTGDLVLNRDPLGNTTAYEYDVMGRPITITTDGIARATQVVYDRRGRVKRLIKPIDATRDAVTEFEYDLGGRRTAVVDPQSRRTQYTYDEQGRPSTVQDAVGGVTRYTYDARSQLAALTDAKGQTTRFEYDAYGRISATIYPGGARESYSYDATGRLVRSIDRKDVITSYDYDSLGRAVRTTYSDGTPAETYQYDAIGRLVSKSNGTDTLSWAYDAANGVVSESSVFNGTTVSYTYTPTGASPDYSRELRYAKAREHELSFRRAVGSPRSQRSPTRSRTGRNVAGGHAAVAALAPAGTQALFEGADGGLAISLSRLGHRG